MMKVVHQKTRTWLSFLHYLRFSTLSALPPTTDTQLLKCVLDDCKTSLDLKTVLKTHVKIVKLGFGVDFSLVSHLLLTYISCGNLDNARCLLDETPCWNVDLNTGNVMISSFMKSGDVDAAKRVFLARAGQLDEAYATIRAMPMQPGVVIWKTLLSSCRTYKNAVLGEIAVTNVSSRDGGDYVLLSNTCCSLNQWNNSENVRDIMKKGRVHKDHGRSWIELGGVIHHFKAGNAHPEKAAIDKILKQLNKSAEIKGFVPATELVLMDVSEEEREENLSSHSEKLALAFGVLKISPRTEIRISKNLRTCSDCHSWFKIVTRMLTRAIIVRDRIRFQKFDGVVCSCGDYW